MKNEKESTERIRLQAALSDILAECGIDPYLMSTKQLLTIEKLVALLKEREERAFQLNKELKALDFSLEGLSRFSAKKHSAISISTLNHNPDLKKIINYFKEKAFPENSTSAASAKENKTIMRLQAKLSALEAENESYKHQLEEKERTELENSRLNKIIANQKDQNDTLKKRVDLYYEQLDEIRKADQSWAQSINKVFKQSKSDLPS